MPNMTISPNGLRFIVEHEGYRSKVYDDGAGYPTIGVGHLLRPEELASNEIEIDGKMVRWTDGLTRPQVMEVLDRDVDWAEHSVNSRAKVKLTQSQFDALVSFVFNVGDGNFAKSTLLRRLNQGDYRNVPYQMSRWVYAAGKKMAGLVKRRADEAALFQSES